MIQLVYVCSSFISLGLKNSDSSSLTTGYLTVLLYSFVLLGLLKLFHTLANPMGYDSADFPGDSYQAALEKTLLGIHQSIRRSPVFGKKPLSCLTVTPSFNGRLDLVSDLLDNPMMVQGKERVVSAHLELV